MLIDIVLILIILAGFWAGYSLGGARALFQIVLYFVSLVITLIVTPFFAKAISHIFPIGLLFAFIFGTIGLFIVISFLLFYLTKKANHRLGLQRNNPKGKWTGGILMSVFCILLYGLVLGMLFQSHVLQEDDRQDSYSYSLLKPVPEYSGKMVSAVKPIFKHYFDMMEEAIQDAQSKE